MSNQLEPGSSQNRGLFQDSTLDYKTRNHSFSFSRGGQFLTEYYTIFEPQCKSTFLNYVYSIDRRIFRVKHCEMLVRVLQSLTLILRKKISSSVAFKLKGRLTLIKKPSRSGITQLSCPPPFLPGSICLPLPPPVPTLPTLSQFYSRGFRRSTLAYTIRFVD